MKYGDIRGCVPYRTIGVKPMSTTSGDPRSDLHRLNSDTVPSAEPVAPPPDSLLEHVRAAAWHVVKQLRETNSCGRAALDSLDYSLNEADRAGVWWLVRAPQGDAPEYKVLSPEHRAANEESFKQSGLDWCAHQMAYNWPRNRFGSLLTEGEYEALVRGGASSSGSAPAGQL